MRERLQACIDVRVVSSEIGDDCVAGKNPIHDVPQNIPVPREIIAANSLRTNLCTRRHNNVVVYPSKPVRERHHYKYRGFRRAFFHSQLGTMGNEEWRT